MTLRRTLCAVAALLCAAAAHAEIVVGVSLSTTGPSASLGITQKHSLAFYPDAIGGEKLRLVVVDDASDPATGTRLARKLVTEEHVDLIVGSSAVAPSIAIAEVATESQTPQLSLAPVELKPGKGDWTYRLAQPVSLMAEAIAARMAAGGIRTVGFIGFADAYGESWLKDFTAAATSRGLKLVDVERYARADTNVTGQVARLVSLKPDAILVAGAGTGAALPHTSLRERGYAGPIYQTHGAATRDLIRIGGKAVDGAILPAGPVIVAEQLPDSHPSKQTALDYVTRYEKAYGPDSRTQFGAHTWDALQVLQRIVPVALRKAKPGTPAFRRALKDALETERDIVVSHGVLNYSATDHFGFDARGRVLLTVDHGKWKLLGGPGDVVKN
ncbi:MULTISPECIES: ABC transporter substrate-binding protein [Ralstonia solanacearum species complex]|uniref:ABC transporter substrate-binding protein n=1 Tax=Ralstonia solanacearum species complex TaxID=3116862 RepID=UPI000E58F3BE|nr:ABC transporter substrate-binding protein [Ralstonia solanacearum]BEU73051.1 ABC transporter substrate-binding protein [Ralstonia pseudosolanacearum]AXV77863.1 branched-chain amino acid ABC transporter substrate-binding protein [Ralstonia solanacearum]AXV91888.1 branched-chain amino acid ABC transporter substrate-binding protein [Ralstonia solanacearum]AXW19976.1 branched-chain amino acid ABC transporter substrate-binding protein [Ralstonia solanacearum]AXW76774.1 branched-chain amino acid 